MNKQEKHPKDTLEEELLHTRKNVWDTLKDLEEVNRFNKEYISFLNGSKTEREVIKQVIQLVESKGFKNIFSSEGVQDRLYYPLHGKSIAVFRRGEKPLTEALNILVAHVDSPRLDLKQYPVYEDQDLVLFKTHYYGGIRKYHWVSIPLAFHGIFAMKDGSIKEVIIGENESDPVFTIADLLPHLSAQVQKTKKATEFIPGEKLNILVGSLPVSHDVKQDQRFKLNILKVFKETYGISEEDFLSADIELVPAGNAREVGLDRSMVGAYGHDDRVCAYTALRAILDVKNPKTSALVFLMDKEEIGSEGASGSNTWFPEMVVGELLALEGNNSYRAIRRTLSGARCLSADVNAAVHPDWKEVHDLKNAAFLNGGLVLTKFTGARGKAGSSEANAEFVAQLRKIFDEHNITWQMGELGKVDEGGGGTIAKFMAYYGMQVIDAGVPVLGMHSTFEVVSKGDVYETYRAFQAMLTSE
ncbi:MAG: aminopeptidase [Candidatus Marinimicrobia bacterium]|nr:aminopeptidase [Candidatus Neomarinimicrobiota bacterium]